MNSEQSKAIKMINEVMIYFFNHHFSDLEMSLNVKEKKTVISVSGYSKTQPDDLVEVSESLLHPRQPEVEEYYWRLLGTNNKTNQLHLLGALVDDVSIMYEENLLTVQLIRHHI